MSMANVEIFRTNISSRESADWIVGKLSARFPKLKFNVDLHDHEKVLRMEGELYWKDEVQRLTKSLGFVCEEIN